MHRRMVRRLDRTTARFERGQREEPLRVCAVRGVAQASEDLTDGKRGWIDRVVRPRIADLSMDIEVLSREHGSGGADALAGGLREEGRRVERRGRSLAMFASRDSLHGRGLAAEAREGDDGLGGPPNPKRAPPWRAPDPRGPPTPGGVPERAGGGNPPP